MYYKVRKCMYGLKQVAHIAFDNLFKVLAPHRYSPLQESPSLWKHQTHSMVFTLCVEYFGMKSNSLDDAHRPIKAIQKYFK